MRGENRHCPGRSTLGLNFTVPDNRRYMIMSQKMDIPVVHSFFSFRNTLFCCARLDIKDEKVLKPGSPSLIPWMTKFRALVKSIQTVSILFVLQCFKRKVIQLSMLKMDHRLLYIHVIVTRIWISIPCRCLVQDAS